MRDRRSLIKDPQPLRACEVGDAQTQISNVFSPHTLEVVDRGASLDVQLKLMSFPTISLVEISHGTEVEVTPGKLRSYFNVGVILAGHTRTTCGRDDVATTRGTAAILSPHERTSMRWSADCRQLAVKIDRVALEGDLEAMLGRPLDAPLAFDVLMDTTSGGGRAWFSTVTSLITQVNDCPALTSQAIVVRRFESLLIGQLLLGQSHNYRQALMSGGHDHVHPRRVRAAIDLIESSAGQPLTATDLARAAGVSLRSLQDDFREHLGVTPMTYLRNVRLGRAHEDLLEGDADASSPVTEIAYRWGFSHVPRFAANYRERFGETPSETLRRRR